MKARHLLSANRVILSSLMILSSVPAVLGQSSGDAKLTKRVVGDYGYWSRTQNPPYSSAQIPFQDLHRSIMPE